MYKVYTDTPKSTMQCPTRYPAIIAIVIASLLLAPAMLMAQGNASEPRDITRQLNALLNQNKHQELQEVAEEIKEKAMKDNDPVRYFYAWRNQIISLRNQVKLYDALQEANEMLNQASKETGMSKGDRDKVVFMSYEVVGKIFEARGDYTSAIKYLKHALECADEDLKRNGYELSIYNALARVYRNDEKYEESLDEAEKGLKLAAPKSPTAFKLLQSKAFALYYLDREKEFMATYYDMKRDFGEKENFDRLNIRKYAYDQNFAQAHQLADNTKEERERIREHLLVYMAQGDWKSAYLCEKKLKEVEMSRQQALLNKDLASLSTKYDAERLRADNLALEMENSRMVAFFIALFVVLVVAGIYIMFRNEKKHVEKLRATNRDLAEARDKAEASDRMKTKFVQNISHEIRTPLNAIVGFSDLLTTPGMKISDEEKREFSDTISKNTTLLTNIVNDMLELSDLQSGDAKAEIVVCQCNKLCRMALSTASDDKPENVEMRFTTNVDDEFTINTDRVRLGIALGKFLSNAKKYTSEGQRVLDCSTKEHDGYVTFSVTDTGCGVPKEKQSTLFHSFEKIDNFKQGAGLGLYLCSMIAKLLDGNIGIDPNYTNGSRFYISLPMGKDSHVRINTPNI